jgi:salicylate hydroxylase
VVLLAREKNPDAAGAAPKLPFALLRSARFDAIMAAAEGNWSFWPLNTVTAPRWHAGGIGLVGDAAHAMLPFQAQGAAMALEDAAILAPLLVGEADAQAAFARFLSARHARVARVARTSAANGRIFHMEWPFSLGRDLVLALGGRQAHMKRLAWLYGYDPTPGA